MQVSAGWYLVQGLRVVKEMDVKVVAINVLLLVVLAMKPSIIVLDMIIAMPTYPVIS